MSQQTEKPCLVIASHTKAMTMSLVASVSAVLEEHLDIQACVTGEDTLQRIQELVAKKPGLVLVTGLISYSRLAPYFPAERVMLTSMDTFAPQLLDELFLIPPGETALVTNFTEDSAMICIHSLQALGIDHLNYVPYWPDCGADTTGIKIAISPGFLEYCPPSIPQKIDIGYREFSLHTFLEILKTYQLDDTNIIPYVRKQMNVLISTYRRLSTEYQISQGFQDLLRTIVNELDEAIISIDHEMLITEFNAQAEKLFQIPKSAAFHTSIDKLFSNIPEITPDLDLHTLNTLITVGKRPCYIVYVPLRDNVSHSGLFIIREVSEIQKKDDQVRKLLYGKNYGYIAKYTFDDIALGSAKMSRLISDAKRLALTDSTILITGESGTGKELLAQSIHNYSPRADNPFVAVNFAALSDSLIESELFGYDEGAFTGAKKTGKKGLFELAHNGTIFLDEIGDASLWVQARLLRALEEKEIMRIGGTKVIPVNVRIIAASNKDLRKSVAQGNFRADLFYRLNVFRLHMPALRERQESIPLLIQSLLKKFDSSKTLTDEAMARLLEYPWQGNIRELKNVIEYAVILSPSRQITVEDLPYDLSTYRSGTEPAPKETVPAAAEPSFEEFYWQLQGLLDMNRVRAVLEVLSKNSGGAKKMGRSGMIDVLRNCYGMNFTDASFRTILRHLSGFHLILVGTTKQGTSLSESGEAFLNFLRQRGGTA